MSQVYAGGTEVCKYLWRAEEGVVCGRRYVSVSYSRMQARFARAHFVRRERGQAVKKTAVDVRTWAMPAVRACELRSVSCFAFVRRPLCSAMGVGEKEKRKEKGDVTVRRFLNAGK